MSQQKPKVKKPLSKKKVARPEGNYQQHVKTITSSGPPNPTLAAIVDPYSAPKTSWPDSFTARTHVWRAHRVIELNHADTAADPVSMLQVCPHPDKMLVVKTPQSAKTEKGSTGFIYSADDDSIDGNYYTCSVNADFQRSPRGFSIPNAQGCYLYGNSGILSTDHPENWSTLQIGDTTVPVYDLGFSAPANCTGNLVLYTHTNVAVGNFTLTTTVYTIDPLTGAMTSASANSNSIVPTSGRNDMAYNVLPADTGNQYISFYVYNNGIGRPNMDVVSLTIGNVVQSHVAYDAEGYAESRDLLHKVRCVGISVLVTNMNPDLTNGGAVAIVQHASDSVVDNFAGLSKSFADVSAPETSYNGPLKKGLYGFVRPEDVSWPLFKRLTSTTRAAMRMPSLTAALAWQSGVSQTLRIQVDAIFEATTESQILGPRPSRCAPVEILAASDALMHYRNVCENPLHEKLVNAIKTAASRARQFYGDNKTAIHAALNAGKTLAGLALSLA